MEYVPTEKDMADTAYTLMILHEFPDASVAYFAESQAGADWTEARLAEAGYAGVVQYVVADE